MSKRIPRASTQKQKDTTHDGTRTRNLALRRGAPYPLGHAGRMGGKKDSSDDKYQVIPCRCWPACGAPSRSGEGCGARTVAASPLRGRWVRHAGRGQRELMGTAGLGECDTACRSYRRGAARRGVGGVVRGTGPSTGQAQAVGRNGPLAAGLDGCAAV